MDESHEWRIAHSCELDFRGALAVRRKAELNSTPLNRTELNRTAADRIACICALLVKYFTSAPA